jgi:hypothetical protein
MKETNVYMKEINQKVMKNGKTRKADWVQIILLVTTVIVAIVLGV